MIICSWNVNSVNARLPRVLSFLERCRPDIVCLQELKCTDEKFPLMEIQAQGYEVSLWGQKTYNGVAILSRQPQQNVHRGWRGDLSAQESRYISAQSDGIQVASLYVPNGREVQSDHYHYKLRWLSEAREATRSAANGVRPAFLLGDFNITPDDRDVHDPAAWHESILCSSAERQALRSLLQDGWVDVWRHLHAGEQAFSWWDYRNLSFPRNQGLRIDLILANRAALPRCQRAWIERDERKGDKPSDHAPVLVELS